MERRTLQKINPTAVVSGTMKLPYPDFFRTATGRTPYDWQRRLAEDPTCQSRQIDIPTGLGKTAGVVLAWLWNRLGQTDAGGSPANPWPRRLVYCLPMRTLVEQTEDEVKKWLMNLQRGSGTLPLSDQAKADLLWLIGDEPIDHPAHSPIVLMGGEDLDPAKRDWDLHPERPAILIGTQDMLLSRALNRGYGMSRARWPMHFGLLNNDTLWVFDETQLMGVGVRTSAQLQGLRHKLGTTAGCATWWASATLDSRLLFTPDHTTLPSSLTLEITDRESPDVSARIDSVKRVAPLPITLAGDASKLVGPYIESLAAAVLDKHQSGFTTLVILNRVDRAQDLRRALDKQKQKLPECVLVHSRFRPLERDLLSARIKEPGEKIIIATQAIEAGVDISARTLITELAPWSSLVQRFGRCNRKGEFNSLGGADIFWINLEADDPRNAAGLALPYTPEQLSTARSLLHQTLPTGASPAALRKLHADEPLTESHVLRRKDLVDLFDTTPDLAGLDLDVARYIRDDKERDVQVFWRDLPQDANSPSETILPERRELVRVAVHAFRKFAEKNKGSIWRRHPLDGNWEEFRDTNHAAPGQIFLVDTPCGGYSVNLGWTGEKAKESFPVLSTEIHAPSTAPRDGQGRDDESQTGFQTLAEHTARVVKACTAKVDALSCSADQWREELLTAALWHDVGKAHPCFQNFLTNGRESDPDYPGYRLQLLAKAPWKSGVRFERPHFRHELASALAWLQNGQSRDERLRDLVAYLIATHHGKVRLSLRAMPNESIPSDVDGHPEPDRLHARGIWDGDKMPADDAPPLSIEGIPISLLPLDLSPMRMGDVNGSPSWSSRVVHLRDATDLGIFRLAWLETILRAADAEGSKQ
jgi:CRISPR-associated endonuclease/helicase Cas3